jgi:hypothetical protein
MSYIHFGHCPAGLAPRRLAHLLPKHPVGFCSRHTRQETHVSASTKSFVAFASDPQPRLPRHDNKLMNFNRARSGGPCTVTVQLTASTLTCGSGWVGFRNTQISMLLGITQKRNVRSKFWWFTRSCNSHYVSHFAAFFIVVGSKTSIAESCNELYSQRNPEWGHQWQFGFSSSFI